jgi:phosphoribosylamine--glycine ligase
LGVVMAAAGYPDAPRKGDVITGIPEETPESVTFHAGTALNGSTLSANGGRVLCVVGLGDNVRMAQKQAYAAVDSIHFDGAQFRRDIGWRAIKRHG